MARMHPWARGTYVKSMNRWMQFSITIKLGFLAVVFHFNSLLGVPRSWQGVVPSCAGLVIIIPMPMICLVQLSVFCDRIM